MRRLLLVIMALALAAGSARAGAVLYATAASQRRIDGFCLNSDGSIVSSPLVHQATAGLEPRRVKVFPIGPTGEKQVLYIAELDQIEAFSIGDHGFLRRIGATPVAHNMDPRDLFVDGVRLKLYVPQRGYGRIVAYDLDAEGAPVHSIFTGGGFTSCIQGMPGPGYLDVWADPTKNLLYASADGGSGRIEVHALGPDGGFVDADGMALLPDSCKVAADGTRAEQTPPVSERRKLQNPKAFVIQGDMLYVEERFRKRITSFQLQPSGLFCPPLRTTKDAKNFGEDCDGFHPIKTKRCARREATRGRRQQCPASHTRSILQYEGVTLLGDTLIGAQFFKGRVDSYRLRPAELGGPRILLPRGPTATTVADARMTPVGLAAITLAELRGAEPDGGAGVVYVAAGELDRVTAYPLDANGVLTSGNPFSRTDVQTDSFPSDVAIAVLPGNCG